MRHAGTQTIETERLLLRPLTPEDAPMMYANWANDPDVTRWLRWEPHKNVGETRELLAAWALLYPNGDYYQWAIVEKSTRQVFGSIGVFTSSSAEPERDPWPGFDHTNGVWEVGYCIGKAWWNKGFTTEALKAVVEYWFKNTDSALPHDEETEKNADPDLHRDRAAADCEVCPDARRGADRAVRRDVSGHRL